MSGFTCKEELGEMNNDCLQHQNPKKELITKIRIGCNA